jgi:hypothetical protein
MSDVKAVLWWTAAPPAGGLIGAVLTHDTTVNSVRAFVGTGHGFDEDADAKLIAEWGAPLDPDLGRFLFPAWAEHEWRR